METGLLRIGAFAKLGGVTVKTLHHYESLRLIQPTATDRRTSYRYYRAGQLASLNAIVALAAAGVPLKLIPRVLAGDATARAAELQSLRATMARRAEHAQRALGQIDALIREAQRAELAGETRPGWTPVVLVKCEPARTVRSLEATARSYADIDQRFEEMAYSTRSSGSILGAVWHRCVPGRIRCEIIADVLPEIGTGRRAAWPPHTSRRLLPASMVASTTYRGDADGSLHYTHLRHWIAARGGRQFGPAREWYPDGSASGVTEIQIPFRAPPSSSLLPDELLQ